MKFKKLADYFSRLEKTQSRLEMTAILAGLFKEAEPEELKLICYLSQGRLAPQYVGAEFNLASKMMIRVLARAYQQDEAKIRQKYRQLGDLGDTTAFFDQKEKAGPLSIKQVYDRLSLIARESGTGSVERKIQKMAQLLDELDGQSAKYVVRIPLAKLRLGFSDLTILDALSWLVTGDKSKRAEIERAYNTRADVGEIARLVKIRGLKSLKSLRVKLGVPVIPALCQRLGTTEEMIEKMGKVAAEPKYDGTRLQIHFSRAQTRIFTRNLENVTAMFPDIVRVLKKEIKAKQVILDGEAIGFDPKTGKFLAFQETIKRKRKYEVAAKSKEIPLKFFCFDALYQAGQSLLTTPFSQRRQILKRLLAKSNQTIKLSPQILTDQPLRLQEYHQKQLDKGLEGIVVKKWQAPYEPGRRGYTWVKLKSIKGKKGAGLTDTLDCVILGYYRGLGKRAGFGIGAFLVGIRSGSKFLTISKIGTGLTDEQWREMRRRCQKVAVKVKPKQYQVDKNLEPGVWCSPQIVVEIEADNITQSPIHTAGYALRFPRLVRFRDDKSASQANTLAELKKLFQLQITPGR